MIPSKEGPGVAQRLSAAVESAPSGLLMVDSDGRIVLVNREVERLFGYSREELLGAHVDTLVPERFRGPHQTFRAGFQAHPTSRAMGAGRDLFGLRKDGAEIPVEIGLNPVVTDDGTFILSSVVDISERKRGEAERRRLEELLRSSQKLEAVGTLAGGIAHDFNNILGAVMAYAELLLQELLVHPMTEESARPDLEEILRSCRRGKALVQQILTFSRRQEPSRRPVQVREPIAEVIRMLEATTGPAIQTRSLLPDHIPLVMADPSALHQVLMNLGVNASQAMPSGGVVEFSVRSLYLSDSVARAHPRLREGPYLILEVRDTGLGMDPAVRARAFEPFFTTKAAGAGTGLGLSVVHGIVTELGGAVEIDSIPGEGTCVRCFLPCVDDQGTEVLEVAPVATRGTGQKVTFVDDEPSLCRAGGRRLSALGFEPRVWSDPGEALEAIRSDPGGMDVLVSDFLMPGMNGLELAREVKRIRPDLPILLLTGNAADLPPSLLHEAGITGVLLKPVTMEELALAVISAILQSAPGGSGSTGHPAGG